MCILNGGTKHIVQPIQGPKCQEKEHKLLF